MFPCSARTKGHPINQHRRLVVPSGLTPTCCRCVEQSSRTSVRHAWKLDSCDERRRPRSRAAVDGSDRDDRSMVRRATYAVASPSRRPGGDGQSGGGCARRTCATRGSDFYACVEGYSARRRHRYTRSSLISARDDQSFATSMTTVMVVLFGAWRKALITSAVVLVGIVGLLVMHGVSFDDPRDNPPATSRFATNAHRPSLVTATSRDPSMPMTAHLHVLLGCLWLVAAAGSVALAMRLCRRLDLDRLRLLRVAFAPPASQRAPPTSVRLSLVGISRR